jgi:hypothetical protein
MKALILFMALTASCCSVKRTEVDRASALEWLTTVLGEHGIKITDAGPYAIAWSSLKSLTPETPGKVYSDYGLELYVYGVSDLTTVDSVMQTFREKYGGKSPHKIVVRFYPDREKSVLIREFEIGP